MRRYAATLAIALVSCKPTPAPMPTAPRNESASCAVGARWNKIAHKCEPIPVEECAPGLVWNKTACMPCADNTHFSSGHCVANSALPRADRGEPKWIANTIAEPQGMIVAGWDHDAGLHFYVCRAAFGKGNHPGRLNNKNKQCHITWGAKEVVLTTYDVLIGTAEPTWEPVTGIALPANAYVAGEEGTTKFVLCRVENGTKMLPGKVVAGTCQYALDGAEMSSSSYDVAVFP